MKVKEIKSIQEIMFNFKGEEMMKKVSILLITTLMLGACASTSQNEESASNSSSETTTSQTNNSSSVKAKEQEETEKKTQFIAEAFSTLLNYDNDTYNERNSKIDQYFTQETLDGLIGYEHLDDTTQYVSTIEITDYYQNVGDNNRFVLTADTTFQVDENQPTELTNIYEIQLIEKDGQYLIESVETTPKQQQTMIP